MVDQVFNNGNYPVGVDDRDIDGLRWQGDEDWLPPGREDEGKERRMSRIERQARMTKSKEIANA